MKKNKIILFYIHNVYKSIHLAIYNLKAYTSKYLKDRKNHEIIIEAVRSKNYKNIHDTLYPVFSEQEIKNIVKKISLQKPNIVGFSTYIWNVKPTLEIAKLLKIDNPNIKIVLGGPEATYHAEEILKKEKYIDIIVIDEGEETFLELTESLIYKSKNLSEIKGIFFKIKNKIIKNRLRDPIDLKRIPSPYLMGLIDLKKYSQSAIYIETSRGCPYRCAFCSYNIMSLSKIRFFPLEKVNKELIYVIKHKVKNLKLIDDNFNLDENRAKEILKTIISYNKTARITLFFKADLFVISKELADLLSKIKIYLSIGVQALKSETLRLANRISHPNILKRNLELLNKKRVTYGLGFIIGLPGDTFEDVKKSMNWAISFKPKSILFQVLRIYPNTIFYENAQKFGFKYYKNPPYTIYESSNWPKKDLERIKHLNYVFTLFYHKSFLRKTIQNLRNKLQINYSDIFEHIAESIKLDEILFLLINRNQQYEIIKKIVINILYEYKKDCYWKEFQSIIEKDINRLQNLHTLKDMKKI